MIRVYRPLPLHIEALEYDGENAGQIETFAGPCLSMNAHSQPQIWDEMLYCELGVDVGSWIVKTTLGSFTVIHQALLAAAYERVE
jgi:hypothetical protein